MPRIQKLEDDVIALIAAGEVVERPASVVKELVENALDAGARSIEIALDEGGASRIQVVDDGCGMAADEVLLALERHATSKIRSAEDLEQVITLGFRGEALPSIAAVSRLQLETRPRAEDSATRVLVEGGVVRSLDEMGAPVGTRIAVRDLFFNTPARRKFLKSAATETARAHACVVDLALAAPGVRFVFESNGRRMLDAPAAASDEDGLRQRLGALLGREFYPVLFPFAGEENGILAQGYFAAPTHTRRDTRGYHFFVNGRAINDRGLMFAVRRAYRTLLDDGRHPVVVAHLQVPPQDVDVNVHPTKQEARFRDDRAVADALAHAIAAAAARTPWAGSGRTYVLAQASPTEVRDRPAEIQDWHRARVRDALDRFARRSDGVVPLARERGSSWGYAVAPAMPATPGSTPVSLVDTDLTGAGYFTRLQPVGQIFNTYLVCQRDGALVLVDQHAAHERITFERLRARRRRGRLTSQRLLVPLQLELEPGLLAAVDSQGDQIAGLGFELELFGGTTLSVRAVPSDLGQAPVEPMVRDLLAELSAHGSQLAGEEALDHVCATLACHGSVRAGRALAPAEIQALLRDLDGVDFGAHCPHGRPVARELTRREIEQLFERV
ncbi:MAG: DNA mismatch repair endonuclease MutL [Pseudomonadota bacterium]